MSVVINKATLQIKRIAHTPEYLDGKWIINPEFPECEEKYFKIDGDAVKEMTANEKKAKDIEIKTAEDTAVKERLIGEKQQAISRTDAIAALKVDGVLDNDGNLIGG